MVRDRDPHGLRRQLGRDGTFSGYGTKHLNLRSRDNNMTSEVLQRRDRGSAIHLDGIPYNRRDAGRDSNMSRSRYNAWRATRIKQLENEID